MKITQILSESTILETQDVTKNTDNKCPLATQDITLNLKNRQKAIDEYGYGPMNPALPNTKFWMKKVDEWNLDSAEEAKQSLCGNCAAFDQRTDTLDCIAQGIGSDQGSEDPTVRAGNLGYCRFLKFKCASRRTCDAWVTGGPLTDDHEMTEDARVARKAGQPANSKKHSDLYTDENPRGTITGLKFATVEDARASVSKIRNSSRSHAHKIQAAVAMEQRARAAEKSEAAAVYRRYINSNKKTESVDQAVTETTSESKSNVTSVITDFYKTQLSQSKPGKVENYNSKAKELLSQSTGKQRAKVLTMLKTGSKNPYLQGVIITIVGSIVSGAVIKHFGSMGLSPQQFNMILQGSMNSIIPTLAAKLHGMSWSDAIKTGLASVAVGVSSAGIMEDNAEYDDESGMAHTNLHTIIRAAEGLLDTIDDNENLPEWVQEKIANVENMIVSSWDYLKSQEEQGIDPRVNESNWLQEELNKLDEVAAWQKKSGKNKNGGLNQKGVNSYRREHPGSKLQTAVTTKPSKLKPGSKAAKRRKSFCARMSGVKGPMKKDGKPTRKALALRKWNC